MTDAHRANRDRDLPMDHRGLIDRYVTELLNGTDTLRASRDLLTDEFLFTGPGNRDGIRGPAAFAEFQDRMREAFADLRFEIDDAIVEEDRAAVILTMRGRHSGPFLGIEPAGNALALPLVDVLSFAGDRIAKVTAYLDALDLRRQLERR
jgi:steroid delta-isomerase-like uncharacterized protein